MGPFIRSGMALSYGFEPGIEIGAGFHVIEPKYLDEHGNARLRLCERHIHFLSNP